MVKLLKRLLWIVAVLVILVIGAVIAVPLVIEPRDVADELAARVKQQTGRDLVIAGEPQLSLFPWLGVDVSDLTLSQPAGFGSEPFAGIGKAQLRVKLMPLLSKRLEMDTVVLSAVRLNLVRRADGVTNFDDLTALAGGGAARRSSTESPPASAGGAAGHAQLAGLAVGGLNLLDAQVVWDDRQAGRAIIVAAIDNLVKGSSGQAIQNIPAPIKTSHFQQLRHRPSADEALRRRYRRRSVHLVPDVGHQSNTIETTKATCDVTTQRDRWRHQLDCSNPITNNRSGNAKAGRYTWTQPVCCGNNYRNSTR